MERKQLIGTKTRYFRHELLLEDDFIAEQRHHDHANFRHNLNLHGWGIARGLEVTAVADSAINVGPGLAIDSRGREIEMRTAERLELSSFQRDALVTVALSYEEDRSGSEKENRIQCYGVLSARPDEVADEAVVLAKVQLDGRGRLTADSISTGGARYLRPPRRTGWLRLPFRATVLRPDQEHPEPLPPAFLVGITRAVTPQTIDGRKNTSGAGGTMAIPLPPGATQIHRLRIAGEVNEAKISVELWMGGWDATSQKHVRTRILRGEITGQPYDRIIEINNDNKIVDEATSTLCLWLSGSGNTSVSLVALEFSY